MPAVGAVLDRATVIVPAPGMAEAGVNARAMDGACPTRKWFGVTANELTCSWVDGPARRGRGQIKSSKS